MTLMKASFLLLVLLSYSASAFAQETTGRIFGQVTDQTGAILPGVSITVRNEQTGLTRAILTDERGSYTVLLLPVGFYSVKAEFSSFKTSLRTGIQIDVNENKQVNIRLEVGDREETVSVTSDVAQVETTSSALSRRVLQKEIIDLPLNGRNFLQLGTLLPGVVPIPTGHASWIGLGQNEGFSVNGMQGRANRFLIDGASNNELFGNGAALRPPPDALQEFNIITNSFSAEFGQGAGSIVNIVTRTGTDQLRGGIFEFMRNDALDARNFFATGVPPLKQNQFGGMIGGPLSLPGYNGRGKTHFFAYYEGFRNRQGVTRGTTVPTAEQRRGDLSAVRTPIIDPLTARPFPGNIIPEQRVHPIAKKYLEFYPLPNGPGGAWITSPTLSEDKDQFGGRIDYSFSAKNNFYSRYLYAHEEKIDPFGANPLPGFSIRQAAKIQSVLLADTHVFSPRLLNELRFNYLRDNILTLGKVTQRKLSQLGFEYPATSLEAEDAPPVSISGFSSSGGREGPLPLVTNVFQLQDNVSLTKGKHILKFGADIRSNDHNLVLNRYPSGSWSFTGSSTGYSLADFLLGLPNNFLQGGGWDRYWSSQSYNFYGQDDYRIHPRLTLNLGLRWELNTPFVEERDRLVTVVQGKQSTKFPEAPAGLLYPGDPGIPRGIIDTDKNNWAPRVGLAWDLSGSGKTSLRAGYGVFYDPVYGHALLQGIEDQPFSVEFVRFEPPSFTNPFQGIENPLFRPGKFSTPVRGQYFNRSNRTPYSQLWNLTLQREVAGGMVWDVGYVASKGTKLLRLNEQNPAVYIPGASSVRNTDERRLRFGPNYSRVVYISTGSSSSYHSLQTSLNKRLSNGVTARVSYTWSKVIDFVSRFFAGETQQPRDALNFNLERGLAQFDMRHRFVVSYAWEVPFGQNLTGIPALLLKGWQVNGITSFNTGNPFSISEPIDVSLSDLPNRPDLIGDPNKGPKTVQQWFNVSAFRRLNPTADAGRIGTAGRNIVTAPGLHNWDMSFIKTHRIGNDRQANIQFRGELFNIFNHANFEIPDSNISSQNFGRIQIARDGRIIQLGLKLNF